MDEHVTAYQALSKAEGAILICKGALGASIETYYGAHSIAEFASRVRESYSSVRWHIAVFKRLSRLQSAPHGAILDMVLEGPLYYSHLKAATGVEDDDEYVGLLTDAHDQGWTVQRVAEEAHVKRNAGKGLPTVEPDPEAERNGYEELLDKPGPSRAFLLCPNCGSEIQLGDE
jgi:hypothetical protein